MSVIMGHFQEILDENVKPEGDNRFSPPKALLLAYRDILKAYDGHITSFNPYSFSPQIVSDDPTFQDAARKTLTDIQLAYTNGQLSKNITRAFIDQRFPTPLAKAPVLYQATIFLPRLTQNQEKSFDSILLEIEKRCPNYADFINLETKSAITISTHSSSDFGNFFHLFKDIEVHFNEGHSYNDTKIRKLVEAHFDDSHLFLSVGSRKAAKRREEDRKNKERITTREVIHLTEIDDVRLYMFAEHIRTSERHDIFASLEQYDGYAKATLNRNDKSDVPYIELHTLIKNSESPEQYEERIGFFEAVIKKAAQQFGTSGHLVVTPDYITGVTEQVHQEYYGSPSPFACQMASSRLPTAFMALSNIEQLSHDELHEMVQDHLPASLDEVAFQYGINLKEREHRLTLAQKLFDLTEDGRLVKQNGRYKHPKRFEGTLDLQVFLPIKKGHKMFAEPLEWNEEEYGVTPRFIIEKAMQRRLDIQDNDVLTVALTYQAGKEESFDVQNVTHVPTLSMGKDNICAQDAGRILNNPDYHKGQEQIPTDNILSGVVAEEKGQLFFKPSIDGVRPFALKDIDPSLFEGHIIKVEVDPSTSSVSKILGQHGHVSDHDGWSKLSALEAGIDLTFPDGILDGVCLDIPTVSQDRKDFRNTPFITIDPKTAKDFDDAIYVEKSESGWTVYTAIADVSHYIKPESPLYHEAFKRGTSIYLPDLTIPMLPEALSNNVCSLKPHENRAALVTTIKIDTLGNITDKKTERGLINSTARLDYEQVQAAIEGNPEPDIAGIYESHIKPASDVYKALLTARENRGALDLDTPEQRIDVSKDGTYTLQVDESNESHGLIEELMIATNRAAIHQLIERNSPLIARVHGEPNERTFKEYIPRLSELGVDTKSDSLSLDDRIQSILEQAKKLPDKDEITQIIVRVQDRAHYSASLSPHYALQLEDGYSHFTSPIRRLADLFMHYLTNEALGLREGYTLPGNLKRQLPDVAQQASDTERLSDEIQRKSEQRVSAQWVQDHLGEVFNATITHVSGRGAHITIKEGQHEVRSIIPVERFRFAVSGDPNSDAPYKPGSQVHVATQDSNPITGVIAFSPA